MSDVIQKPGTYKQQNGKPAEVKWVGDGKAIGFDCSGDLALWQAVTGMWGTDTEREDFPWNITGPWIPDPPKGFVVMPKKYVAKRGDLMSHDLYRSWQPVVNSIGTTAEQLEEGDPAVAQVFIASPIPKPSVDPGEGWRLLGDEESPQFGDEFGFRENVSGGNNWLKYNPDDYHFGKTLKRIREFQGDDFVVRRRVVPQPEWTPTNGLRLAKTAFDDPLGTWYGKGADSQWLRIEQRWTNGTDSEWRPVTVEGA